MNAREQARAAYRNYRIQRINDTVGHKYSHKCLSVPVALQDKVNQAAAGDINPAYRIKLLRRCMTDGKMAQLKKYAAWQAAKE